MLHEIREFKSISITRHIAIKSDTRGRQTQQSGEIHFGPYCSIIIPTLHETHIELDKDSHKRPCLQKTDTSTRHVNMMSIFYRNHFNMPN